MHEGGGRWVGSNKLVELKIKGGGEEWETEGWEGSLGQEDSELGLTGPSCQDIGWGRLDVGVKDPAPSDVNSLAAQPSPAARTPGGLLPWELLSRQRAPSHVGARNEAWLQGGLLPG